MYFRSLPAEISSGENKGKPNLVEITSAKLEKDGKPVKFEIAATRFQYPQFGPEPAKDDKGNDQDFTEDQAKAAIEEAVKDAGGYVAFVGNYNDSTRTAALNKGKNYIRTKETGEPDAIVEAGLDLSKNFTWASAQRVTNKEVREGVENLVQDLDNLDEATLKARLKALMGAK